MRYAPHIGRVTDPADGSVLYERKAQIAGRVEYAGDALEQIRAGMEDVALYGAGAPYFQGYPVKVACKTGTAEVPGGSANSVMILYAPRTTRRLPWRPSLSTAGSAITAFPLQGTS